MDKELLKEAGGAAWLRREYLDNRRSGKSIASELGCRSCTVYAALRKHGIPVRTKSQAGRLGKSGTDFDDARMAALYEAGASTNDLKRMFGASPNTVLDALRRQGVKVRTKKEAAHLHRNVKQRRLPRSSEMIGVVTRCAACDRTENLELHHVNADATDNRKENLIALCWEHHMLLEMLITKALCGLRIQGIVKSLA